MPRQSTKVEFTLTAITKVKAGSKEAPKHKKDEEKYVFESAQGDFFFFAGTAAWSWMMGGKVAMENRRLANKILDAAVKQMSEDVNGVGEKKFVPGWKVSV